MPFVKLDTGLLNSTLWVERDCREVFITSLLMAEPREFTEPQRQIEIGKIEYTGFIAPPGWYGFVPAASSGIINRAMVDKDKGLEALVRLGSPDSDSRSKDFDGRRMIRVDGGFLILNYIKYREKDYTAAERAKRYRDRKRVTLGNAVTSHESHVTVTDSVTQTRNITQAEAEEEAYTCILPLSAALTPVDTRDSPEPPTIEEIKQKLHEFANGKVRTADPQAAKNLETWEWVRAALTTYPDAHRLPGKPDDKILRSCLDMGNSDTNLLAGALTKMAKDGKRPATSWMWFPTVLKQYLGGAA